MLGRAARDVRVLLNRGFAGDGTLKARRGLERLGVGPLLDSAEDALEEAKEIFASGCRISTSSPENGVGGDGSS